MPSLRRIPLKVVLIAACLLALGLPVDRLAEFVVFFIAAFAIAFGPVGGTRRRLLGAAAALLAGFAVSQAVRPPLIDEGFNAFLFGRQQDPGVYHRDLPPEVFAAMAASLRDYLDRHAGCRVPGGACEDDGYRLPDRLYAYSVDGFWNPPDGFSRRVRTIDFTRENRLFGPAFNDDRYNWDGSKVDLDRQNLPAFVAHRFPPAFDGSRLCWQGTLHRERPDGGFSTERAETTRCVDLSVPAQGLTTFVDGADPDRGFAVRLERPWPIRGLDLISRGAAILGVALAVGLLLRGASRHPFWLPALAVGGTLLWALGWDLAHADSVLLSGLTIYRGGADGIVHDWLARSIVEAIGRGDWREALRGGEDAFHFQPGLRYALALGKLLFGETHYAYLLFCGIVIVATFRLVRLLLPQRWAVVLILLFVFVPVLERFGFALFLDIYQVQRGYAEPLGYGLFILGLAGVLGALKPGGAAEAFRRPGPLFACGLALAAAMLVRGNLAIGGVAAAAPATAVLLGRRRFACLVGLGAGLALVLLGLWHNYAFGGRLAPFSVPETNLPNLTMPPSLWAEALGNVLHGEFRAPAVTRMIAQIRGWNAPSDFYRVPVFLVALVPLGWWRRDAAVATLAAVALAQQAVLFFYNPGGRYAYLAWMLSFLAFLVVWRERVQPAVARWRGRAGAPAAERLPSHR